MQGPARACIMPGSFCILSSESKDISADEQLPLHLRIRVRGPPGQDGRPDLGRRPRRHPGAGQARPRGLRDDGEDRRGDRGGRSHHLGMGRHRGAGAQGHQRHRLRQQRRRLRRPHLRHHQHARQAVAGHQPGRGSQEARGTGRRRPGPDVRLRLQRGAGVHAGPAVLLAPAGRTAGQGAQVRQAQVAASGRQVAGDPALRGRHQQDPRPRRRGAVHPARRGREAEAAGRGRLRDDPGAGAAEGMAGLAEEEQGAHQPDRQVRHRRAGGRLRPDRPQDHRRHLRRHGPPRRRRVLRQGPVQGRSLGRLRGALRRQEHRGRRPGRPLRGAGVVRHRRCRADLDLGDHLRHRQDQRRQDREADPRALRPAALRHHPDARPAAPDLPADRQLRPLRPRAGAAGVRRCERQEGTRHRLLLGEDGPGQGAARSSGAQGPRVLRGLGSGGPSPRCRRAAGPGPRPR